MPNLSKQRFAVITADISGSRNVADFRKERDKKLRPIAKQHKADGLILSEYAVTAWDEFEGLAKPSAVPTILLDLRRHFYPLHLWIGVGIGSISVPYRKPINVFGGGEAFERARLAVTEIKEGRSKSRRMTAFLSGNNEFDLIANTMYHLHDTLIQSISAKQWATINAQLSAKQQLKTARKLGLDKSSVSRNLRRGFFSQIEETRTTMRSLIERYFTP
jgi:SatD family (SatD)